MKKHKLALRPDNYTDAVNRFNTNLEQSSSSQATIESYFKVLETRKELYRRINEANPDLYNHRISSDPTINNGPRWFNIYQKSEQKSPEPKPNPEETRPCAAAIICLSA